MIVGVPKEIKKDEHRIALAPAAVEAISAAGHTVLIQKGRGSEPASRIGPISQWAQISWRERMPYGGGAG